MKKVNIYVMFLVLLSVYTDSIYSQPANDDCANAINIPNVNNFCSAAGAYTTVGATSSFNPAQSCWGGTVGNDVWFKFVATASDVNVTINGNVGGNGTLNRPKASIVFGDCAATLNEFGACTTAPAGQNTLTVYKSPLAIGQTYYIRVSAAGTNTGTFQLCINNFVAQPNPGADCGSKNYLCSKDPVTITKVIGAGTDNREAAGTCMDASPPNPIEGNTAWYYWTAGSNGTLTFTLTPLNVGDDIDWVLFDLPNGNCVGKQWLRCCAAGDLNGGNSPCLGPTGLSMTETDLSESINCLPPNNNFVRYLDMVKGKTYALLVENFSSANSGFNLSFGGTGTFLGPTPKYTASDTTICVGSNVVFTDASLNTISYKWNFGSAASPVSSTVKGPHTVNYSTPGTYTVTLTVTSEGGCVDSLKKIIIVKPYPTVIVNSTTICKGESTILTAGGATSYTWTPTTGLTPTTGSTVTAKPPTTTTYTVVGSTNGCTASATAVVTTKTCGFTVEATGSTVCSGICGDVTSTVLGGTPPFTYLWNTGATTSKMIPNACPTFTTTYTITVTDSSIPATSASASAVITVIPSSAVSVDPVAICKGASTTLTASGATNYSWSPITGLSSGTGAVVTANPTTTTTYTVTGDPNGCSSTTTVIVTVNPIPIISVQDASICPRDSVRLTASGAITYSWSPTTGLSSNSGSTVMATPNSTTVYTVIGISNGCSSSTSVTVSVAGIVATVSPDATICLGKSTSLIAGGGTTYTWLPTTGLSDPNIYNPVATPAVTTTYTVVVASQSCSNTAVVVVTVADVTTLSVGSVNVTCFGACDGKTNALPTGGKSPYSYKWSGGCTSVICNNVCAGTYTLSVTDAVGCTATGIAIVTEPPIFTISAIGGDACPRDSILLSALGGVTYTWSPSTDLNINTGANVIAKPAITTSYIVTGINNKGCTATAIAVATIYPKPDAKYTTSPDAPTEFNPSIYFNDLSTGGVINYWKWSFGDSLNTTSLLQNPLFTYPPFSHTYTIQLIVINQQGCIDTVVGEIFIHGIFTFYIPNTFTPNDDGTNDRFLPRGTGIDESDYDLWIFDRWGNMIWHTNIWGEGWDGRAKKGTDIAQIDTYVWKAHVKEKDNGAKHNYIGHVNILK